MLHFLLGHNKTEAYSNIPGFVVGTFAIAMGSIYILNLPQMVSDALGATRTWGWAVELTGILTILLSLGRCLVFHRFFENVFKRMFLYSRLYIGLVLSMTLLL